MSLWGEISPVVNRFSLKAEAKPTEKLQHLFSVISFFCHVTRSAPEHQLYAHEFISHILHITAT